MACKKWIHTPEPKGDPYWDRVRAVAEGLHSDGCTLVADWYLEDHHRRGQHSVPPGDSVQVEAGTAKSGVLGPVGGRHPRGADS
jgi:hypothetical protein